MFKAAQHGNREVNIARTEDVIAAGAEVLAVNCPFCMTMMRDGTKHFEKENDIQVLDIAELVNQSITNA